MAEGPSRFILFLLAALIPSSGFVASSIADPASIPRPWSFVVAVILCMITFLSTSVLAALAYSFMYLRDMDEAQRFMKAVANHAGIGAIFGTLIGLRLAEPLLIESRRHQPVQNVEFVDFISLISNTATVVTLALIGLCWVPTVGLMKAVMRANVGTDDTSKFYRFWLSVELRKLLALSVLLAANLVALKAAFSVWVMLDP
ncbi:hypothetical protein [Microbispora triticiradicis]|uniref:hypothetical protein n=1 Tax=Microbispora triticiradicis TaxID=2200763 RepID=UPI001AD70A0B|nr:hypothetical protein [Microbispora triticiradicis]MBO4272722.1 hypothetical protein [Microbispora triticiradicis]